tara:strand:+ start:656 stop:760 length:105 start_codon:yes stop_codon:yes gene_type:complete
VVVNWLDEVVNWLAEVWAMSRSIAVIPDGRQPRY